MKNNRLGRIFIVDFITTKGRLVMSPAILSVKTDKQTKKEGIDKAREKNIKKYQDALKKKFFYFGSYFATKYLRSR